MEKLTADQKKTLAEQIKELDPKGEIVTLSPNADFSGGTIAYRKDSGLTLGESVSRLKDEEYVRAWLVVRLIRLFKYPADCLDIEHTYTIGRPSPTKAQIDIRVHDKRGKKQQTFMIIEAKRPDDYDSYTKLIEDQLFAPGRDESTRGLRYAVWHTVEFRGDEPHDKCIIIDFKTFTEYRPWIEAGEPGHIPQVTRTFVESKTTHNGSEGMQSDKLIDINGATSEELQELPGIGEKLAGAIIASRPFHSVKDLLDVPGIGSKKFGQIEALVEVK